MNSSHESMRAYLRALALIVVWLFNPLMGAVSGAAHAAVTGTMVAWGNNDSGQTTLPAGLSGVVAIAAGGHHTVALKSDGTVVAWGETSLVRRTYPPGWALSVPSLLGASIRQHSRATALWWPGASTMRAKPRYPPG